jgi:hypothetical protein
MLPEGRPDLVTLPALVICLIYLLISLRRVHARSWLVTTGRFLLMGIPYFVVATILFITGMLWGFFLQ